MKSMIVAKRWQVSPGNTPSGIREGSQLLMTLTKCWDIIHTEARGAWTWTNAMTYVVCAHACMEVPCPWACNHCYVLVCICIWTYRAVEHEPLLDGHELSRACFQHLLSCDAAKNSSLAYTHRTIRQHEKTDNCWALLSGSRVPQATASFRVCAP